MDSLDHFYYGQLIHHGTPAGEARVLAKSNGITDEHVKAALKSALLPALANAPDAAFALVRGGSKDLPYIFVQAQIGSVGQTMRHFYFPSGEMVRTIAGNIRALLPLIEKPMPEFAMLGDALPPAALPDPTELTTENQVDLLLDLMSYTRNNTRTIEPLLSAIIRNVPLVIQNAPPEGETRATFIQGLLSLLPSSTRFAVMFATHLTPGVNINAQVAFYDGAAPENAVIYDWETGKAGGVESKDDYSHFIVSQLRLDAELVTRETEKLTKVAGWRFRTGESLANALAYASHRARVDQSLQTNLPVEAAEIAKILAEDPTLDDTLRPMYAEHLIRFALALDEPQHANVVAPLVSQYPDLEQRIHAELMTAVQQGNGSLVFELLRNWLDDPRLSWGTPWTDLLHAAALAEMDELVQAKDTENLVSWLDDVQRLDAAFGVNRIAKRILEAMMPFVPAAPELAPRLLLMAMAYLDNGIAQKLLNSAGFVKHLPVELRRFVAAMQKNDAQLPAGIIPEATTFAGEKARPQIVLLLADMAYRAGRYDLLDMPTLQVLAEEIALSTHGQSQRDLLIGIARSHTPELVGTIADPAPQYVFQLLLATGQIEALAQTMIVFARDVYGVDHLADYVRAIQRVFANVPLPTDQIAPTLGILNTQGITGIPRLGVVSGILQASGGAPEIAPLATDALQEIEVNPRYIEVMPVEVVNGILHYAASVSSGGRGLLRRVIRLLPEIAAQQDDDRVALQAISQAHKLLRGEHEEQALELLCGYLRFAPEKPAQRVLQHYSKDATPETAARLNMAYGWSSFTGRKPFASYLDALHTTANLLETALSLYLRRQDRPSTQRLITIAENWRVRLDTQSHRQLGADLLRLAKLLAALGKHQAGRSAKNTDAILLAQEAPQTPADVYRAAGGHLARGKAYPYKLQPVSDMPATPFGDMSAETLREHIAAAVALLRGALDSITGENPTIWQPAALTAELDSLTAALPDTDSKILRQAAQDFQRLADLIPLSIKDADISVVQDDSRVGKKLEDRQQQPRNLLELLRFFYGCLRE